MIALFASIAGAAVELSPSELPVGICFGPAGDWRVLTVKVLSVPAYTIALNLAMQTLSGPEGFPPTFPKSSLATRRVRKGGL